jgi:hypothetical protein
MQPVNRSGRRHQAASLILVFVPPFVLAACGGGDSSSGDNTPKVIHLTGQPQHVVLPAHKKYGIYVNDANNSGYSLSCAAKDAHGRQVHMDDQTPPTISSSGTNNLDLAYNTGSGDLTFTCSASGAQTTTGPLAGVLR